MTTNVTAGLPTVQALRNALRTPPAIGVIAQDGADDPERLDLFLRLRSDDQDLSVAALEEYCICIQHAESLEPQLARFALPMCLDACQRCLFRGEYAPVARAFFDRLAGRADKIARCVGDDGATKIMDFMRDSILAKLSACSGLAIQDPDDIEIWLDYIACYGAVWPDIGAFLTTWIEAENLGLAISAVQYLSLLVYDDAEHPIFCKWAGRRGGAAPLPWAAKDVGWLPINVDALEQTLSNGGARAWLARAVTHLKGHPDESLARLILEDMDLQPYRINARVTDLVAHMSSTGSQKYWSDNYGMTLPHRDSEAD